MNAANRKDFAIALGQDYNGPSVAQILTLKCHGLMRVFEEGFYRTYTRNSLIDSFARFRYPYKKAAWWIPGSTFWPTSVFSSASSSKRRAVPSESAVVARSRAREQILAGPYGIVGTILLVVVIVILLRVLGIV